MKTGKTLGKVIGIILSVCMLMSLFTCLSGISASAVTSDKMFEVTSVGKYPSVGYLSADEVLVSGKSYTFTCKFIAPQGFDFSNDSANLRAAFGFWGAKANNSGNAFWWRMTSHTISYDAETKTVTAKITASDDSNGTTLGNYIKIVIGDRNGNFRGWGTFYFADPTFVCDDDPSTDLLANCPIDADHYVANGSDSTLAQNKGLWVSYDDSAAPETPVIADKGNTFDSGAAAPSNDMLHIKESVARWRPSSDSSILAANTDYRVSFYWENLSGAPVDGENNNDNNMFYAKYYDGSNWSVLFKTNNTGSGVGCTVTRTPVLHGEKVDVDFTTPATVGTGANIFFLIGDFNYNYSNEEFNIAHIKIYERDGDNLTDLSITDLCANANLTSVTAHTTDAPDVTDTIVYRTYNSSTAPNVVTIPTEKYFDEIDSSDKLLKIKETIAKWRPSNGLALLEANADYRVSFYWENMNSAPVDGDNNNDNNMFYAKYYNGSDWSVLFKVNNTGAGVGCTVTKTPATHGQKIDVDFTAPADVDVSVGGANIFFLIGDFNYAYSGEEFHISGMKLYERNGNTLNDLGITDVWNGSELVSTSESGTGVPELTNAVIYRTYSASSELTAEVLPAGYFEELGAGDKMLHFNHDNTYAKWKPSKTQDCIKPDTDYRISFYWENVNGAPVDVDNMFYVKYKKSGGDWAVLLKASNLNGYAATDTSLTKTPVAHGEKIEIDFTSPSDCADGGSIFFLFGDWNDYEEFPSDLAFNIAGIKLYERNGDTLTDLGIADFGDNTDTIFMPSWNSGEPSQADKVFYRSGVGVSAVSFANIPEGYFDPIKCDFSGDGLITVVDLVMFKQARVADPTDTALDLDDNGIVSNDDHLYLIDLLLAS